ncbi:TIGR02391 family protein [Corynebacterium poyangense]|uniref:TIGR02391 family protein n=1 Tax=Corynebacterium poyangense TaxID=2684405 RepID=A0A7H0SSJ2_9CORY|nr:TIGR02391 family protein [Corynebacterium poyangense]QNQ91517.1 TIGR02391 family protein [Corynebacterium poyangense]
MASIPLRADLGEGYTKWRRLNHAVLMNQKTTRNGNALVALIRTALEPERTLSRASDAQTTRDEVNQALSLTGLKIRDDGVVISTDRARTVSEAKARTEQLRQKLIRRSTHPDVLTYCRPELVQNDYYEAVFESIKGLGSKLRQLSGIDEDGSNLVDGAMLGSSPLVRINSLQTKSQRSEQVGVANLVKGLFSAFRNPAAHEPRIEWSLSEQDALDVLGTLSLIHRRLDEAETL